MDTKTQSHDHVGAPQHSEPQPEIAPPQPSYQGNGAPQHAKGNSGQTPVVHATPLNGLGSTPAIIDCPLCNQRSQTRVDEHDSSMTIVAGIGLGIFCICAACLPCILHWFQDVDHICLNCNQRVCHIPHGGIPQVIMPPGAVPQQYAMGNHQSYGGQHPTGPQQPQEQPPQYTQ